MTAVHRCLVIENDPTDDPRRLGEWLVDGGLELEVCRPYQGEEIPVDLAGYPALVVLGGDQHVYPDASGQAGAVWFPALEALLRRAVRDSVPTLAVCLGAQLLTVAHAGAVRRSDAGPEFGAGLVAKRDAAERDPLFLALPMLPDVVQWHHDEITELPRNAVLLAASTTYPHQAFRIGRCAWAMQFHIECDTAMIADWAYSEGSVLVEHGLDPAEVVAGVAAVMDDLFEVWQPFAQRFAALARSGAPGPEAPGRELPLVSHERLPGA